MDVLISMAFANCSPPPMALPPTISNVPLKNDVIVAALLINIILSVLLTLDFGRLILLVGDGGNGRFIDESCKWLNSAINGPACTAIDVSKELAYLRKSWYPMPPVILKTLFFSE